MPRTPTVPPAPHPTAQTPKLTNTEETQSQEKGTKNNISANQSARIIQTRIGDAAGRIWNPAQTRTSIWFV